jgi:hypothetical protein
MVYPAKMKSKMCKSMSAFSFGMAPLCLFVVGAVRTPAGPPLASGPVLLMTGAMAVGGSILARGTTADPTRLELTDQGRRCEKILSLPKLAFGFALYETT